MIFIPFKVDKSYLLEEYRYDFLMILIDVLLFKDPGALKRGFGNRNTVANVSKCNILEYGDSLDKKPCELDQSTATR